MPEVTQNVEFSRKGIHNVVSCGQFTKLFALLGSMPNSTFSSKTTSDRPSDIFHIALLVLCAVGFFVLYFKVDLDGSLNATYIANVSQQVERVERRLLMMEKIAHQKETPAPQFQTSTADFTQSKDVVAGADMHKIRISELEKIQQKIQPKQPKAKYQLVAVEESLTVSSGDEVCISSGGPAPLEPKGSCGFSITVQPLDKHDRSYLPGEGMMTGELTKYAEVIKRPGLEDGPGAAGEFTAHYGETEYRISVLDSTEGPRTGVLNRDQVLDAVFQAFKK